MKKIILSLAIAISIIGCKKKETPSPVIPTTEISDGTWYRKYGTDKFSTLKGGKYWEDLSTSIEYLTTSFNYTVEKDTITSVGYFIDFSIPGSTVVFNPSDTTKYYMVETNDSLFIKSTLRKWYSTSMTPPYLQDSGTTYSTKFIGVKI